jgi:hypothetical protein
VHGHPIQPGEVRNPEGRIQYTYREHFDQNVAQLLGEVTGEAERNQLPAWVRGMELKGLTRGQVEARFVVAGAFRGE